MTPRNVLKALLVLVLGLPVLESLLAWVAGLLAAMGDAEAAGVLGRINVAAGVLWLVALVALVILLGLKAATEPVRSLDDRDEPPL